MKKKILNFTSIIILLLISILILTACNNTEKVETKDDIVEKVVSEDVKDIIKKFATSIESNDENEFLNIIDISNLNSIIDYEITEEELKDLFSNIAEAGNKYEVSNIEIATKSDVENVLKSMGKDMNYDEVTKRYEGYELYSANVSTLDNEEMQDIFLLKKDGDKYIFGTSLIWLSEIELYHLK